MVEPIAAYKGRDADELVKAALAIYEEGREIEDASKELDVPTRTLHRWLATNAQDKWYEAQKGRALADFESSRKRRDTARIKLEELKQQLDNEGVTEAAERNWRLTHARDVLRAADTELGHQQWLLERLMRRIYGQEHQVASIAPIQINIGISRTATIEEKPLESE